MRAEFQIVTHVKKLKKKKNLKELYALYSDIFCI